MSIHFILAGFIFFNVIIGVDSMKHLEANLKASYYSIGEESIKIINTIKVENLDLLNPSLWK
jgi:aryl-alcohol dehydrogenase-like predicted oxidoreductase